FTVDTIKPFVYIYLPENISYSTTDLNLNYTVTDTNLDTTWYQYNGTNTTLSTNITFTALDNQQSILILWSNDTLGNLNQTTVIFTVDTIKPFVYIYLPENISYSTTDLNLNYTATDINLDTTWYQYNDTNTTLSSNTTFTALDNQQSTLILWSNDSADNIVSWTVTFTVDTSLPILTLLPPTPDNNTHINKNYAFINWSLAELNPDTTILDWNGTDETMSQSYSNRTGLTDGIYTYYVWVNDTAGNSIQTETRTLTIDTLSPEIEFIQPTPNNDSYISENYTFINWSVIELYRDTTLLNWNGTIYNISQDYLNLTDLDEGIYRYHVWVNDTAGNENQTETNTLTIDVSSPEILIESPLNKSYNYSILYFNLTATDMFRPVDKCIYSLDSSENITLLNDTETHFYIQTISIDDGNHTVIFYCNDTLGNLNFTTEHFIVDTAPPEITIVSPKNKYYNTSSIWFNITVFDTVTSVDKCSYSLDNRPDLSMLNDSESNYYYLNSSMTKGDHNITFYCNDSVGNLNSIKESFKVDLTPPVIQVISPNKFEYNIGDVWFKFNVSEPESSVALCSYSLDGADYIDLTSQSPNYYSKLLYDLFEGTHNVTYYCENTVGFSSTTTAYFNITIASVTIRLVGSGFLPDVNTQDNYIASDLPQETVTGLVHANGDFKEVSSNNGMSLRNSIGSITYLVYTKGTTDNIEDRTEYIRSDEFEKIPNPSFGFPITKRYKIYVGLEYSTIDLNGKDSLSEGFYELNFKNTGVKGESLTIEIER
ncbi:MAG: hypothetical protein GQ477_01165, partial [Nanohaloarchaea archaeon]|nr:hypothetical protein [Candidatus Nanohaloarchaea archaeon]